MDLRKKILLSLAVLAGTTTAYATTISADDFSSGLSSGGSGWDNDWQPGINGAGNGEVTFADTITPLGENNEYVSITGSGSNTTRGIHRRYSSALSSIEQEHTITFLFRLDVLEAGSTGDPSRGLVAHGATSFGLGADSTWAFYVQEGTFHYFNGNGSGGFQGAQTNSDIPVVVGELYSVSVTNRIGADTEGSPLTGGEWDLLVTNLTTDAVVLDLTNLEHRTNTISTEAVIGLGVAGNNETSFDEVIIDADVEPNSGSDLLITDIEFVNEDLQVTFSPGGEGYILTSSDNLANGFVEVSSAIFDGINAFAVPAADLNAERGFFRVEAIPLN